MTLIFLVKLILAHLIGDFVLQPSHWVTQKALQKIRSPFLYYHIMVHSFLLFFILGFHSRYILGILLITLSHFIIDVTKVYIQKDATKRWAFFIDQFLHIAILVLTTHLYFPFSLLASPINSNKLLLFFTALILVTKVASVVMQVLISRWDKLEEQESIKSDGLDKAGYYIGILERLFVIGFIVLHHWEGVGFLLAAKSIFRFGDLSKAKDRKLTEYILIGTLISFGLAIAIAVGYVTLKDWII